MDTSEQCCHYLVKVKTGDRWYAGTDATISLKLMSGSGESFPLDNLKDWGIMEADHSYFYRGNLDFFFVKGPCLNVCAITVTSNGEGSSPGWYLDYVEITTIGPNGVHKKAFPVDQWLALDEPPYHLHATVNLCDEASSA